MDSSSQGYSRSIYQPPLLCQNRPVTQTDLFDDGHRPSYRPRSKDLLPKPEKFSSASIDSGYNKEPTKEHTREFSREWERKKNQEDVVPYVTMKEFKEIMLSERTMFRDEMQMMLLVQNAQSELISELKVTKH